MSNAKRIYTNLNDSALNDASFKKFGLTEIEKMRTGINSIWKAYVKQGGAPKEIMLALKSALDALTKLHTVIRDYDE